MKSSKIEIEHTLFRNARLIYFIEYFDLFIRKNDQTP